MAKCFVVLFLLCALASFSYAGELEILSVSNVTTVPENIYAGDLVTVTFDVENISGAGAIANDVVVLLELNENYFTPVIVSENLAQIRSRGVKTVSLRFQAKGSVLPGNYKVPIFFSYKSGSTKIDQPEEIDVEISACRILKIEDISLSSSSPHIGGVLDISASVKNICSTSARNVGVELRPVTNSTIAPFVVTSGTLRKIGYIAPNSESEVSYSLELTDNMQSNTYVFAIDANCDDCRSVFSNSFSFLARGTPELVFSNIEYSVENALGGSDKQILQGSEITLSVQLDNIGEEKAKAVEIAVDFGEDVVGSSKSFLGNIDAEDSGAAIFNLTISPQASSREHEGKINVSYIDSQGIRQSFEESYSIYVNESPPTSPIVYILILILVLVVLGVVYFIIKFIFRQLAIRKSQSR